MAAPLMFLQFWTAPEDREVAHDVELAMSRAGILPTKAAAMMNLNPSQWTKQREGLGHISLYRLARLGPEFARELIAIRAARIGLVVLPEGELTAALLQVVGLAQAPMMGMHEQKRKVTRDVA